MVFTLPHFQCFAKLYSHLTYPAEQINSDEKGPLASLIEDLWPSQKLLPYLAMSFLPLSLFMLLLKPKSANHLNIIRDLFILFTEVPLDFLTAMRLLPCKQSSYATVYWICSFRHQFFLCLLQCVPLLHMKSEVISAEYFYSRLSLITIILASLPPIIIILTSLSLSLSSVLLMFLSASVFERWCVCVCSFSSLEQALTLRFSFTQRLFAACFFSKYQPGPVSTPLNKQSRTQANTHPSDMSTTTASSSSSSSVAAASEQYPTFVPVRAFAAPDYASSSVNQQQLGVERLLASIHLSEW